MMWYVLYSGDERVYNSQWATLADAMWAVKQYPGGLRKPHITKRGS